MQQAIEYISYTYSPLQTPIAFSNIAAQSQLFPTQLLRFKVPFDDLEIVREVNDLKANEESVTGNAGLMEMICAVMGHQFAGP